MTQVQPAEEGAVEAPPFSGARTSHYPMSDRYVPNSLDAIKGLDQTGLEIETDDVSTFLGGDRDQVFAQLERIFAGAARTGEHVVMTVLLSHGCPGETYCEATGDVRAPRPTAGATTKSGVAVGCQWSRSAARSSPSSRSSFRGSRTRSAPSAATSSRRRSAPLSPR